MIRNIKFLFQIFVIVFVCYNAIGQENKKDLAIKNEVFFNELALKVRAFRWSNLDSTHIVLNEAISHYKQVNDNCRVSHFYALKARLFLEEGINDSALSAFIESSLFINANCPKPESYYLYNSWSQLYSAIGDYSIADSISQIALDRAVQCDNPIFELNVLTNQAVFFSEQLKYDKAIAKMRIINSKADSLNNDYHKWSSLQNLGAFYLMKEDNDSAMYFLRLFEQTITDETPIGLMMGYYNNMGVIYEDKNNHDKANNYYSLAIDLAKRKQDLYQLLIFLKNHSDGLELIKKHEESRAVLQEYIALKDSIYSLEKLHIMKELEKEYESKKQQEVIHQLENTKLEDKLKLEQSGRERDVISLVLITVLIFAVALYRRLRYTRRSKQLVEKAKKRSEDLLLNILPAQVAEEL